MGIGKVLLNLETKLTRLEAINEKLMEAYDQSTDTEAAENFQKVLDEDIELTDRIIDKVSQLKVLKEAEKKPREIEASQGSNLEQKSNPSVRTGQTVTVWHSFNRNSKYLVTTKFGTNESHRNLTSEP